MRILWLMGYGILVVLSVTNNSSIIALRCKFHLKVRPLTSAAGFHREQAIALMSNVGYYLQQRGLQVWAYNFRREFLLAEADTISELWTRAHRKATVLTNKSSND